MTTRARPMRPLPALAAACLAAALAACNSSPPRVVEEPLLVTSHDQVGSVHVSVLSSSPWNAISKELQPRFELKPADALAAVLPVTQTSVERALQALTFGVGIGLGQRGTTTLDSSAITRSSGQRTDGASTSLQTSDGVVQSPATGTSTLSVSAAESMLGSSTSTRATARTPSDGKDASFGSLRDLSTASVDKTNGKPDALGVNPSLQYKLAAALLQDIAALNKHVDALATREGYDAHFVLAQISLMPRSPRLPYDAYVNMSFFTSCLSTSSATTSIACSQPASTTPTWPAPTPRAPLVIPLLSSDNLESTLASRSAENVRQAALGISGVLSGIGLNTQIGSLDDQYGSMLGRQLNSIMTVGRVTDNTLRVRLGAVPQGPYGSRMVARTHNVSLVVLVPKSTHRVTLTSRTEFVDPASAEVLPARSASNREASEEQRVARKYPEFALVDGLGNPNSNFQRLHQLAFTGEQEAFWDEVSKLRDQTAANPSPSTWTEPTHVRARHENRLRQARYLWADLASLIPGSRFNHTSFDLVPPKPPKTLANACPMPQTLALMDDGATMRGTLNRGNELNAEKLTAHLEWPECGSTVVLAPNALAVSGDGRALAVQFPSKAALRLKDVCTGQQPRVVVSGCVGTSTFSVRHYAAAPDQAASKKRSAMTLSATALAANGSAASVHVYVTRGSEERVALRVRGADVASAESTGNISPAADGIEVAGSGRLNLALHNAIPGTSVSFWLEDEKGRVITGTRHSVGVRAAATNGRTAGPRQSEFK